MTLQSQPDERLDDLVCTEQQGQRGQRDLTMASLGIANRIDADGANDEPPDQISLRRKAHLAPA
jgi:hypothetical protein